MDLCNFLAEDEPIEIVPNFQYDRVLNLIAGDFGPFKPQIPTQVPLWMAVSLYKQQKCKIKLPEWVRNIDKLAQEQKENQETLIHIPCAHWREVLHELKSIHLDIDTSYLDLIGCRENILRLSVKTLLDELVKIEEDKISQVKIKNISKFELVIIKELVAEHIAIMREIDEL